MITIRQEIGQDAAVPPKNDPETFDRRFKSAADYRAYVRAFCCPIGSGAVTVSGAKLPDPTLLAVQVRGTQQVAAFPARGAICGTPMLADLVARMVAQSGRPTPRTP